MAQAGGFWEVADDGLTMMAYVLLDVGRWEEAREAFARSLEHWQTIDPEVASVESKAGLAYATWRERDTARARVSLEEVVRFLESGSLSGAKEPCACM
jgi:hypothetical protein